MCDYSLHSVVSRPAKVGDKLTTWDFGTGTRGFAAAEDARVAVCVCQGPNWRLPNRSSMERAVCWAGAARRSITKRRFFGKPTKSAPHASRRAGISGRTGYPPNQPGGKSGGSGASVAGAAYDRVGD